MYLPSRTGVHRIASLMPLVFAARLHLRQCRRTVCFCRYVTPENLILEHRLRR